MNDIIEQQIMQKNLKYLQIETTTTCNQRCHFCPVSVNKRPKATLTLEYVEKIIADMRNYPIDMVFLNGFNEPTYDKDLLAKVQRLREASFKLHLNTNGSGLTATLCDALLGAGVREFTVNLSSLDAERYQATRGSRDLPKVVSNIEYLLQQGADAEVLILVLGQLDAIHARDIQAISQHFSPLGATIVICPIADFAAQATQLLKRRIYHKTLRGCIGQRQRQWLHFTPSAHAILCCQDYAENYRIGSLAHLSPTALYQSEHFAQLRRWIEGVEAAPDDFICRTCVFAIGQESYAEKSRHLFCQHCQLPDKLGQAASCQRCVVNEYVADGAARA